MQEEEPHEPYPPWEKIGRKNFEAPLLTWSGNPLAAHACDGSQSAIAATASDVMRKSLFIVYVLEHKLICPLKNQAENGVQKYRYFCTINNLYNDFSVPQ